ncbi:hypothetical protein EV182_008011 [Spiromyces aspiralis]|uniref:Uncharacterized protein n=1 Tax=Spiromyces aspiralis TaxID=68401 RepID=A0ACC1HK05_9FUNG|nr:hypothetical protein EV182_008011 [Spiromyces aspiralis]
MPNVNGRAFAMTPHLQDQYTGDGGIIMDMRSGPEIIANSNNSGGGGDSGSSPSTVLNLFNWLTAIQNGQPLSMAWSSELMVKNLGLEANHLIMQEQIFIPCRDVAKCSLVDFLDNSTLQHSSYNTNRDEL